MTKNRDSGPNWPTKARRELRRRRRKGAATQPGRSFAEGLARDLIALQVSRGMLTKPPTRPLDKVSAVHIRETQGRFGTARVDTHGGRVRVAWRPSGWSCTACGPQSIPGCPHTKAVARTPAWRAVNAGEQAPA